MFYSFKYFGLFLNHIFQLLIIGEFFIFKDLFWQTLKFTSEIIILKNKLLNELSIILKNSTFFKHKTKTFSEIDQ